MDGWITEVRQAVISYLQKDTGLAGTAGSPNTLQTASAKFNANCVGRLVWVDDGVHPVTQYTIASYVDSRNITLTPNFPVPVLVDVTFDMESSVAAYIRQKNGKFFFFGPKDKLPGRLNLTDFPAVIVRLGKFTHQQFTNTEQNVPYPIHMDLCTGGQDPSPMEFLYGLVNDRLTRGRNERFGLAADLGVDAYAVGGIKINGGGFEERVIDDKASTNPQSSGWYHKGDFDIEIGIRRPVVATA